VPGVRVHFGAEVATLLVMLSWAANVVAVKAAIANVPPIVFAFFRFAAAFLVLLAFLRWREGSVSLPRRDVLPRRRAA
jgi:drug/metabolite transporter (DMT)-like permease